MFECCFIPLLTVFQLYHDLSLVIYQYNSFISSWHDTSVIMMSRQPLATRQTISIWYDMTLTRNYQSFKKFFLLRNELWLANVEYDFVSDQSDTRAQILSISKLLNFKKEGSNRAPVLWFWYRTERFSLILSFMSIS